MLRLSIFFFFFIFFWFLLFLYRPDLVDWRSLKTCDIRERLESAFSTAEREYGVTRLLDPEGKLILLAIKLLGELEKNCNQ